MIRVLIVDHTGEEEGRTQTPRGEQLKAKAERVSGVVVDFFFHAQDVFGRAATDGEEEVVGSTSTSGLSGGGSVLPKYDLALLHMSNTSNSEEERECYARILDHACDHAIEFSGAGVHWEAEQQGWGPRYDHVKASDRLLLSRINAFLSVMVDEGSDTHAGFRKAVEYVLFRKGSIGRLIEELVTFDQLVQGMATALAEAADADEADSKDPESDGHRGTRYSERAQVARAMRHEPWLWFDDCRHDLVNLVAGKTPSSAFRDAVIGMDRYVAPAAAAILTMYHGPGRKTDGALVRLVGCLLGCWSNGTTDRETAQLLLTDQQVLEEAHEEYGRLRVLATGAAGLIVEQFLEYRQYVNHTLWKNRLLVGFESAASARRKLQDAQVWPLARDEVDSLLGVAGTLFGLDSPYLRDTAEPRIRKCLDALDTAASRLLSGEDGAFDEFKKGAKVLVKCLQRIDRAFQTEDPIFRLDAVERYLDGRGPDCCFAILRESIRRDVLPLTKLILDDGPEAGRHYREFWPVLCGAHMLVRTAAVAAAVANTREADRRSLRAASEALQSIERLVSCCGPRFEPSARRLNVEKTLSSEGVSDPDSLLTAFDRQEADHEEDPSY